MRVRQGTSVKVVSCVLCLVRPVAAADGPVTVYKNDNPVVPYPNTRPAATYQFAPFGSYDWTGFYLGIDSGGAWGNSARDSTIELTSANNIALSGTLVGGVFGYNWQAGSFMIGFEGDIDWTRILGQSPCGSFNVCETKIGSLGTARARSGYVWDKVLPYFTGGVAFGNVSSTNSVRNALDGGVGVGYSIGAGVEFAFYERWSATIEYLYVGLGKVECSSACDPASLTSVGFNASVLKGDIKYRF